MEIVCNYYQEIGYLLFLSWVVLSVYFHYWLGVDCRLYFIVIPAMFALYLSYAFSGFKINDFMGNVTSNYRGPLLALIVYMVVVVAGKSDDVTVQKGRCLFYLFISFLAFVTSVLLMIGIVYMCYARA